VTFDEGLAWDRADVDLVGLDEALRALAAADPRKGQVVELRFFGGLSVEETAEALGVSRQTVIRDWRLSRSWLLRELSRRGQDEGTWALGQG
jgi:RNA polymerase sigma factor (sigma-70 family)